MKKKFTFSGLALLCCVAAIAQPVLVSTMPQPPVGTIDSIYSATGSIVPGSGGPGVTWNFSGLSTAFLGTAAVVNPSATPYNSTFPTATLCIKFTPAGSSASVYDYDSLSSANWEQLANTYGGAGTGTDYTPNPESNMNFPFNYTNSFIDTFRKTGGSPNPVTITYDDYGTLITPFGTYYNVVRIYKYYGTGDYDYNWYTTAPYLFGVMSYDAQSNAYTIIGVPGSTTGLTEAAAPETTQLYPNPFSDNATLKLNVQNGFIGASMSITDAVGRIVKQIPINGPETTVLRDGMQPGLYFYNVQNNGLKIATGKLVIK